MKHLNAAKKYGAGIGAAVGSSLLVPVSIVHAAVPAGATAAFTEMGADFTTVFGYGFTALVIITTAMIAWRYTRKLGNKL